ncbi:MAG: response regulator transcription factor [Pseudomonadota bacterium]
MQTVLVADDDSHIREVVCFALQRAGFKTLEAADGRAALTQHDRHRPDLVVLDVLMPEADGLAVCQQLRSSSTVPIVFLSSKDEEVDRILGLELGGDDYLVKPFSPRELVARVKANLRRVDQDRADTSNATLTLGGLTINSDTFEAHYNESLLPLTHTEFCMLATLARNADKVLSRDQLMQGAYDTRRIVSDRTIDSHIRRLRDKLNKAGAPGIKTVHGVGYRLQID